MSYGKEHFTSRFPENLLTIYYGELIKINKHAYLLKDGSDALGFVITGHRTGEAVSNFIKSNRWSVIKVLLKNPEFLLDKIKQQIIKVFGKKESKSKVKCRLISISVHPDHYRKGVANTLISELEKSLLEDGIYNYGLSVRSSNPGAIRLYEKLGFEIEHKNKLIYYKKEIPRS